MPSTSDLDAALPSEISVVREIRECGQRIVYEIETNGDKRVLKLMNPSARNRAEREVSLAKDFDHPNLARILDDELQEISIGGNDWIYFTEEFVDGEPLDECGSKLDDCEVLQLGVALVDTVTYLWERRVVHRDIKPANIMVKEDGSFVLLDVGVGRHQDLTSLTVGGPHGPGTSGYLAPEQLQPLKGRELDYRADLFAIGIVMYEQLTGELPFDPNGASYRTLLTTGVTKDLREDVPGEMRAVITRMLAPRPHGRYRLDKARQALDDAREKLECS